MENLQSTSLVFIVMLLALNISFIIWFTITSQIEKRRKKKIEDRKKAYDQAIEAREKANEEKRRREKKEREIRMARLDVISEESDHSWKQRKQARATIRILTKRLSMDTTASPWMPDKTSK